MNVITATSRLARELRQEYDREQEAAGPVLLADGPYPAVA